MPKPRIRLMASGRGASHADRSGRVTDRGRHGSENADMSNEKPGENPGRRNPKVSRGRFVRPGSVGTSGEADGRSRWTTGQHSRTSDESSTDGVWSGLAARPDGWRVQTRRPAAQANPRGQGRKATVRGARSPKPAMPYSLEKLLGIESESVPKPTPVGG